VADSVAHMQTVSSSLGRSVSIDQAAKLLNVSRRTVYNRIRDGRLRTLRTIGGSQRVLVDSLYENGFSPRACAPSDATASLPVRSGTRN
jgi:excisionase family DNA binding protein